MADEIWKVVEGANNIEISSLGRVRRTTDRRKYIKGTRDRQGYVIVSFGGTVGRQRLHRVIAYYFCDNDDPENKNLVDHINGVKDDNRAENLRWCTQSENVLFMDEQGLRIDNRPGYIIAVDRDTNEATIYKSLAEFAYCTGIPAKQANQSLSGMRKYIKNYCLFHLNEIKTNINSDYSNNNDGIIVGNEFTSGKYAIIEDEQYILKIVDKRKLRGLSYPQLRSIAKEILGSIHIKEKEL